MHESIAHALASERAAEHQQRAADRRLAVASGRDARARLSVRLVALAERLASANQQRQDHAAVVQPRFG